MIRDRASIVKDKMGTFQKGASRDGSQHAVSRRGENRPYGVSPHGASPTATPLALGTPIQYLKGVGPKRFSLFKRMGLFTLRDLIYHLPRRHEDRRAFLPIAELVPGEKATVRGRVIGSSLFRAKTGTLILQVVVKDSTGVLCALWFNQPYMRRWFPVGQELILYGAMEASGRRRMMFVPEFEVVPVEKRGQALFSQGGPTGKKEPVPRSLHMGRIVPIYPATSGLNQREFRTTVAYALKAILPSLSDPLPAPLRGRHRLLDLATALKRIHFPESPEVIQQAKDRLSFEELLVFQLALGLRRRLLRKQPGISHRVSGELVNRFRKSLPFTLTPGQEKAVGEILADMASTRPMHRLLQGEVGSGKTVVAAHAVVAAVEGGFQAALLAPTEVLARQHALTLTQLLSTVDIPVHLLTSSLERSDRHKLKEGLTDQTVRILVGTHALLESWVEFSRLGLVVIDEQQKFGVDQRSDLVAKGENPDLLILTATPIPRTLALTLYGELEISTIAERPRGRSPVRTVWLDSTRRDQVIEFIKKELDAGHQAYWVSPRIGEAQRVPTQEVPVRSDPTQKVPVRPDPFGVTKLFEQVKQDFAGCRVGLLHGRMHSRQQKEIFTAFKRGEIQLLVATQIIEVGVDVPNATVMVVDGADRFGLAQLHQLRGRVGRGMKEGTCVLLADPKDPATAERLQTAVGVSDAFRIAEEDLRFRGPGELLGKRQAGLPDLKCLQWASQGPWLEIARHEAESLLAEEPFFEDPGFSPLRREVKIRFPQLVSVAS